MISSTSASGLFTRRRLRCGTMVIVRAAAAAEGASGIGAEDHLVRGLRDHHEVVRLVERDDGRFPSTPTTVYSIAPMRTFLPIGSSPDGANSA